MPPDAEIRFLEAQETLPVSIRTALADAMLAWARGMIGTQLAQCIEPDHAS